MGGRGHRPAHGSWAHAAVDAGRGGPWDVRADEVARGSPPPWDPQWTPCSWGPPSLLLPARARPSGGQGDRKRPGSLGASTLRSNTARGEQGDEVCKGQGLACEAADRTQPFGSVPQRPAPRRPAAGVPRPLRAPQARLSLAGPSHACCPTCRSWSSPRPPPSSLLRSPSHRPPRPCSRPKAASRRRPSRS